MTYKLKDNTFEAIQVSGHESQFADLKRFCGNSIHISYESCYIDDYWLITLEDDLREKQVTIPSGDYIIKCPLGFTMISNEDFNEMFDKL